MRDATLRHAALRRTVARGITLAVLLAAAAATAGCGGAPADPASAPAVLVTQPDFRPGVTPSCLMHQTEQPNNAYEGGADAQPTPQLMFLAYYTAAGRTPFCDGQPATATDTAWAQLYVRLTGNRENVTTVLG